MHEVGEGTRGRGGSPAVVVFSTADELLARGLVSYLGDVGVVTQRAGGDGARVDLPPPTPDGSVVALVDVRRTAGTDRLAGIPDLAGVAGAARPGDLVAAIAAASLDPLGELRLIEAGAHVLLRTDDLAQDPRILVRLAHGEEPIARLPTRWEARERLGMRWDGSLDGLVGALVALPEEVWPARTKQAALPLSRRAVAALRCLASDAGFPPPDPRRFSTSFRSAPAHPEWATLWAIGRELLGWAGRAEDARR